MPTTQGDVAIYYETRGADDGIPLLLVQGFTWHLIGWHEGFCQALVDHGALVILLDNRDVGMSQKFGGESDLDGGYALADMADDGFRVLDDLGLPSAHVVGASMGGMIVQRMAVSQPSRVRSLNLFYTVPRFEPSYFLETDGPDIVQLSTRHNREEVLRLFNEAERFSASTEFTYESGWIADLGARMYDRGYAPEGRLRQAHAMMRWDADPEALRTLKLPSSIIHGRADRRIDVRAAFDLEQLLVDSELHVYPGLGHEIPPALWNEFAAIIMRTARRGEKTRVSSAQLAHTLRTAV